MKCQKCESELVWNEEFKIDDDVITKEYWSCVRNCRQLDGTYPCDFVCSEEEYQQLRLDKVLSKFDKEKGFLFYFNQGLTIAYQDKKFYLDHDYSRDFSLETVEHILKDLEVK